MPFKDPEKAKANKRQYYLNNIEKLKKRASDWYENNRESVLENHAGKSETLKENCKIWRKNNKDKVKTYKKKYEEENKEAHLLAKSKRVKRAISNLPDYYIVHQIKNQTGLSIKTIKENPELIINHREQIKVKRFIKNIKNGN